MSRLSELISIVYGAQKENIQFREMTIDSQSFSQMLKELSEMMPRPVPYYAAATPLVVTEFKLATPYGYMVVKKEQA